MHHTRAHPGHVLIYGFSMYIDARLTAPGPGGGVTRNGEGSVAIRPAKHINKH